MFLLGLSFATPHGNAQTASQKKVPIVSAGQVSVVQVDKAGRLVRVNKSAPVGSGKPAVAELADRAARRYQVDPLLVRSLIQIESNSNSQAKSYKGAEGIMQLIPATARRFGVADSFNPEQNIEGGVRYLKYLQNLFPADLTLSIAAFNAGEGAVSKYKTVPPYAETIGYVRKVNEQYGRLRAFQEPEAKEHHVVTTVDAEGRLYLHTR